MEQAVENHRRYTLEEYLRLEDSSVEKHEFRDGEIVAMAGGSPEHSLISLNIAGELRTRLKGSSCSAYESNLRLKLGKQRLYGYADATVVCGPIEIVNLEGTGKVCTNPRLVVEVLSSTTEAYDRTTKFDRYREIESLKEYVLVSQDTPRVETFYRSPDGSWRLDFAIGIQSTIKLLALDIELPLTEIYAGVQFPPLTPPGE